jgi:hypothetical protein
MEYLPPETDLEMFYALRDAIYRAHQLQALYTFLVCFYARMILSDNYDFSA